MQFHIADGFQPALRRLAAKVQRAVKETVYDLLAGPSALGLKLLRIDKSKDTNLWLMRVNRQNCVVVQKARNSSLFYDVGHDDAYDGFSPWGDSRASSPATQLRALPSRSIITSTTKQ